MSGRVGPAGPGGGPAAMTQAMQQGQQLLTKVVEALTKGDMAGAQKLLAQGGPALAKQALQMLGKGPSQA